MTYYSEQLEKVNFNGDFNATVKFSSEEGNTKYLDVNPESAQDIINKMQEVILLKETPEDKTRRLERELAKEVNNFIDQNFNMIQLEVFERIAAEEAGENYKKTLKV